MAALQVAVTVKVPSAEDFKTSPGRAFQDATKDTSDNGGCDACTRQDIGVNRPLTGGAPWRDSTTRTAEGQALFEELEIMLRTGTAQVPPPAQRRQVADDDLLVPVTEAHEPQLPYRITRAGGRS